MCSYQWRSDGERNSPSVVEEQVHVESSDPSSWLGTAELKQLVDAETPGLAAADWMGRLSVIGIEKGKAFKPDAKTRQILDASGVPLSGSENCRVTLAANTRRRTSGRRHSTKPSTRPVWTKVSPFLRLVPETNRRLTPTETGGRGSGQANHTAQRGSAVTLRARVAILKPLLGRAHPYTCTLNLRGA